MSQMLLIVTPVSSARWARIKKAIVAVLNGAISKLE
jgi:hypothetical protein